MNTQQRVSKEPCSDYVFSLKVVLPTFSSTNRDMNLGLTYLRITDNRNCLLIPMAPHKKGSLLYGDVRRPQDHIKISQRVS